MLNKAKKKFILIGIIILLVFGGGFIVFSNFYKQTNQPAKSAEISEENQIAAQEIDKDSDNDGLKDWEEELWGTNSNNPDTDGDGTTDSQEVKQGRNPLLAAKNGKGDKISDSPSAVKIESQNNQNEPLSLTEALSRQFFSDYLYLREKGGGQISPESQNELIASFWESINSFGQPSKDFYIKSDIKIDSQETKDSIKDYGNNLAVIIKKYFDPIPESEMALLQQSLNSENEADLKNLEQIAAAYRNSAKDMVSLAAPASFSESHLKLINYFDNIAKEIDALRDFFQDPAQAVLSLKQYQNDSSEAYKILREINNYFLSKGVVFEISEPAEFFKFYL